MAQFPCHLSYVICVCDSCVCMICVFRGRQATWLRAATTPEIELGLHSSPMSMKTNSKASRRTPVSSSPSNPSFSVRHYVSFFLFLLQNEKSKFGHTESIFLSDLFSFPLFASQLKSPTSTFVVSVSWQRQSPEIQPSICSAECLRQLLVLPLEGWVRPQYVLQHKRQLSPHADFINLLDNYEMSTGVSETVTSDEMKENHLFLDAILETDVMKVQ